MSYILTTEKMFQDEKSNQIFMLLLFFFLGKGAKRRPNNLSKSTSDFFQLKYLTFFLFLQF